MKTFLIVFLAVVAALVVVGGGAILYLRYDTQAEARAKADQLKFTSLLLAAGCPATPPDSLQEVNDALDADLDKYADLLAQAGGDPEEVGMARFALENQFRAKGCYPTLHISPPSHRSKK